MRRPSTSVTNPNASDNGGGLGEQCGVNFVATQRNERRRRDRPNLRADRRRCRGVYFLRRRRAQRRRGFPAARVWKHGRADRPGRASQAALTDQSGHVYHHLAARGSQRWPVGGLGRRSGVRRPGRRRKPPRRTPGPPWGIYSGRLRFSVMALLAARRTKDRVDPARYENPTTCADLPQARPPLAPPGPPPARFRARLVRFQGHGHNPARYGSPSLRKALYRGPVTPATGAGQVDFRLFAAYTGDRRAEGSDLREFFPLVVHLYEFLEALITPSKPALTASNQAPTALHRPPFWLSTIPIRTTRSPQSARHGAPAALQTLWFSEDPWPLFGSSGRPVRVGSWGPAPPWPPGSVAGFGFVPGK
jgi:hypothetical protein